MHAATLTAAMPMTGALTACWLVRVVQHRFSAFWGGVCDWQQPCVPMISCNCVRCWGEYRLHIMQAAGEAVLRSALQELQVWGLERKFALITYTPVAGDSRYDMGT